MTLLVLLCCLLAPVNTFLLPQYTKHSSIPTTLYASVQEERETSMSYEYTDEQLRAALDSLLEGSSDKDFDSRHMYGYGQPGGDDGSLSMLQKITATRILNYKDQASKPSIQELEQAAQEDFMRLNLQQVIQSQAPRMALAAEFKRASPSKGKMADSTLQAGPQAVKYTKAGANIISVLTEPKWFQGSLQDLTQVRQQTSELKDVPSRPAVLRKEFIVSDYMIAEAAAAGADTVLLIVAVLPQHLLKQLIEYSRSLDMEPLVEVHTNIELEVALQAGAKVIGVNNRNLHTFQMDLATSERIADYMASQGREYKHGSADAPFTLCALSGMSTADDVDRFRQVGLGMVLIGESLMRAPDPQAAIASLCLDPVDYEKNQQSSSTVGAAYTAGTKIVKVCGITNAQDALVACQAGANLIGVIFAPKSKRCVTAEQAKEVVEAVRAFGERSAAVGRPSLSDASPLSHLRSASNWLVQNTRRPAVVGVFQNQDPAFIRQMVEECGLDLVQLHGKEGMAAANVDNCGAPAIRVVDIEAGDDGKASETAVETILSSVTNDPVAILLDTSIKGQGGGSGVAFDWSIAERVQNAGLPVIVAGGLTPDTVADCVATRPFGVDVSSGVEASPGVKDHEKVKTFVQGARKAAQEASKGF